MFFDRDVRRPIKNNLKYKRDDQHQSVKSGGGGSSNSGSGTGKKSGNSNYSPATRIRIAIKAALKPFKNITKAPPPKSSR